MPDRSTGGLTGSNASGAIGLEVRYGRSSEDWIESAVPTGGVELLRARFAGRAYAKHRHDTYAICLTDRGVQAFDYRGTARRSLPGQVVVLHPDEAHDGRSGSDDGFGYCMVYVAPMRIADAARSLCGTAVPLPFAGEPVVANGTLAKAIADAFQGFPAPLEPLAVDTLIEGLAQGLVEVDSSIRRRQRGPSCDTRALERVRQYLDAEKTRTVTSGELEAVSGLDRFALARQFRQVYGTSPYRYLLMRRLEWVRREIWTGRSLAELAVAAGFADQPHLTRVFKAAYGLAPSQFRALVQSGTA